MASQWWGSILWRVGARTSPTCRAPAPCRCSGYQCNSDRSFSAYSWWPTYPPSSWTSSTRPPTTCPGSPSMTWWSRWTSPAWWSWPPSTSRCPPPSPAHPTSSLWRAGCSLTSLTPFWLFWSTLPSRQAFQSYSFCAIKTSCFLETCSAGGLQYCQEI